MNKLFTILFTSLFCLIANAQTADFTIDGDSNLHCTPSSITFTQNCTGSPVGYRWNFGNGQTANSPTAVIQYNTPGTYTIRLTAIYSTSSVTVSKTITVKQGISRVISADQTFLCLPGSIRFGSTGTGTITSYQWNFGDGSGTINSSTDTISHNFTGFAKYTVKLRATDASGCFTDTSLVIAVQKPPVTATVTRATACVPATTNFSATATIPSNTTVTSYDWNFGDGSPVQTTTANNVSHIYAATGSYNAVLNITTSNGCTSSYNFPNLSYGTPPGATTVYAIKPLICGSETALMVAKSATANRYFWAFGDGATASTNDTIVAHKYTTLGTKSIGVTAYNNGCQGAFTRLSLRVQGVIANYKFVNSCTAKDSYTFTNTSQGNVSSSTWSFGDASAPSNSISPVHAYVSGSQFLSSVIVRDAITGCADTTSKTVFTPVSTFSSPTAAVCKNSPVNFAVNSSFKDSLQSYTWHLLGSVYGPDSLPVKKLTAAVPGSYNNFVVINRSPVFCPDTLYAAAPLSVGGPIAGFTLNPTNCTANDIVITNTSVPFNPADSIRFWFWDKGPGLPADFNYLPAPYRYDSAGTYPVTLTAIDKNSCTDTLTKQVIVNTSPLLSVAQRAFSVCSGTPVNLVAESNAAVSWTPAAGLSCNNCPSVIATPASSTTYFVKAVNSNGGCSLTDSVLITVKQRTTSTSPATIARICSGDTITLDANPKGQQIAWTPAETLTDSTLYNPVAAPLQTTIYTAVVTDTSICSTQIVPYTVVVRSKPQVDAGPDKFYTRGSAFNIAPVYSSNVTSYTWTPQGSLNCTDCPSPSGIANTSQRYYIRVTSDSGCTAADTITIVTNCQASDIHLPASFTPNNDNLNDYFYPLTNSYAKIISFTIFNRAGKMLYAAQNFPGNERSFGWNGKYQGTNQPQGTYVYLMEVNCEDGRKTMIRGSVILLR